MYRLKANRFKVKLGGNLRASTHETTSLEVNASKVYAHTGFSYATFADDVALIKLPFKVPYTTYIRPICLPTPSELKTTAFERATVGGILANEFTVICKSLKIGRRLGQTSFWRCICRNANGSGIAPGRKYPLSVMVPTAGQEYHH